jgi:hypothetical protein
MSNLTDSRLEIHRLLSEEMRHTATVIWQFSIAIVTLQGSVVALTAQSGFQTVFGRFVLGTGLFLSLCFSLMLLRQATERSGFRDRIRAVEDELGGVYPKYFSPIPTTAPGFTSIKLAWLLLVASGVGLLLFFWTAFFPQTSNPTINAIQVQVAPNQTITYPIEPNKSYTIEFDGGKVKFSATK